MTPIELLHDEYSYCEQDYTVVNSTINNTPKQFYIEAISADGTKIFKGYSNYTGHVDPTVYWIRRESFNDFYVTMKNGKHYIAEGYNGENPLIVKSFYIVKEPSSTSNTLYSKKIIYYELSHFALKCEIPKTSTTNDYRKMDDMKYYTDSTFTT